MSEQRSLPKPVVKKLASPNWSGRFALTGVRRAIDLVDDAVLILVAGRRHLVRVIAPIKKGAGAPLRDRQREADMRLRAQGLARRLELPDATAQRLLSLLIGDACRQQGLLSDLDQGVIDSDGCKMQPAMTNLEPTEIPKPYRFLRYVPPPNHLAPLLRIIPRRWQVQLLEAAIHRALTALLKSDALNFMQQRRLAIEVVDLGLSWVFELRDGRLRVCDELPEATVRGSATDLLLLAGRLEDADTLFFQRRLVLTGDTELGLTARNVLDRLPWESLPLGLRIVLNRGARLARLARAAHQRKTEG